MIVHWWTASAYSQLHFTSNRRGSLSGYYNHPLLFSKKIRGRVKKGYFYLRTQWYILPFFPIWYVQDFQRIRISKTEKGLVLDHRINTWGFALVAGGEEKGK